MNISVKISIITQKAGTLLAVSFFSTLCTCLCFGLLRPLRIAALLKSRLLQEVIASAVCKARTVPGKKQINKKQTEQIKGETKKSVQRDCVLLEFHLAQLCGSRWLECRRLWFVQLLFSQSASHLAR